jgi:hypothetical protein
MVLRDSFTYMEKLLIYHAKTNNTTLDEAYKLLREVEDLQYLYKQPTKKSQQSYDRQTRHQEAVFTTRLYPRSIGCDTLRYHALDLMTQWNLSQHALELFLRALF